MKKNSQIFVKFICSHGGGRGWWAAATPPNHGVFMGKMVTKTCEILAFQPSFRSLWSTSSFFKFIIFTSTFYSVASRCCSSNTWPLGGSVLQQHTLKFLTTLSAVLWLDSVINHVTHRSLSPVDFLQATQTLNTSFLLVTLWIIFTSLSARYPMMHCCAACDIYILLLLFILETGRLPFVVLVLVQMITDAFSCDEEEASLCFPLGWTLTIWKTHYDD